VDTEKVCVNLSAAELGKLDLLVEKGLYVNRTDVVRAALRREFAEHDWDAIVDRDLVTGPKSKIGSVGIGLIAITKHQLEEAEARNEKVDAYCAGILIIPNDVSPELADRTISRIRVLGSVRASKDVIDRLGDRIQRGRSR
jgi:Arc/MetJ-type ribon-helix-helix transcriptional regulator